jgi:hypothetical protein
VDGERQVSISQSVNQLAVSVRIVIVVVVSSVVVVVDRPWVERVGVQRQNLSS